MMIQVVTIQAPSGQRDTFVEALLENVRGTREEAGNLRFDLLQDADDDHRFTLFEVFRDAKALDAHRATDHYRQCMDIIKPLITEEFRRQLYDALDVETRNADVARQL